MSLVLIVFVVTQWCPAPPLRVPKLLKGVLAHGHLFLMCGKYWRDKMPENTLRLSCEYLHAASSFHICDGH